MAPDISSSTPDINKSLKEYLNRNDSGSKEEKSGLLGGGWGETFFKGSKDNVDCTTQSSWLSRIENDSLCASLSRTQRVIGFIMWFGFGLFCIFLAGLYAPVLLLKARKFCLLYTLGSLFIISSFSFLSGPYNHLKHLFSYERLPFTCVYFSLMLMTLYTALWMKDAVLTLLFGLFQAVAMFWYLISYIPGGQHGLKFFTKLCVSSVKKSPRMLPV